MEKIKYYSPYIPILGAFTPFLWDTPITKESYGFHYFLSGALQVLTWSILINLFS